MRKTGLVLVCLSVFVTSYAHAQDQSDSTRLLLRYVLAQVPDSVRVVKSGLVDQRMLVALKTTIRDCFLRAPYAGYQRVVLDPTEVPGIGPVDSERVDLFGAHDELHFSTPIMKMHDIEVNFMMQEPSSAETAYKVINLHFWGGDFAFLVQADSQAISISQLGPAGVPGCDGGICSPSGCP